MLQKAIETYFEDTERILLTDTRDVIFQDDPFCYKAEAELEASIKLTQGAKEMEGSPIALELRRMQMLSEIGIDNNTTTIILVPSDFTNAAKSFTELVNKKKIKG
jgi:hypothetical protein